MTPNSEHARRAAQVIDDWLWAEMNVLKYKFEHWLMSSSGTVEAFEKLVEPCVTRLVDALREFGTEGEPNSIKTLASALKKLLPTELLKEVIDHCDPLAAFLRDGFGVEAASRPADSPAPINGNVNNGHRWSQNW